MTVSNSRHGLVVILSHIRNSVSKPPNRIGNVDKICMSLRLELYVAILFHHFNFILHIQCHLTGSAIQKK